MELKQRIASSFLAFFSLAPNQVLPEELICPSMLSVPLADHPRVNEYIDILVTGGCRQIALLNLSRSKVSVTSLKKLLCVAIETLILGNSDNF